jgi:uncharacterized membrane protein (UPF0127 family)
MGVHTRTAFAAGLVVLAMVAILGVAIAAEAEPNFELRNITKKKSAKIHMEVADNEWSRMRGLMFRDKIVPILFEFGYDGLFPIHSYFVKDVFDAVYVTKDHRVAEVFRKIPPSTPLVTPKKNASYLVELPVEVTDRLGIAEGDSLEWKRIIK